MARLSQHGRSAAAAITAQTGASEGSETDSSLIGLCGAFPALLAAFNDDPRDDNPFWEPYIAACRAISAMQPNTMAGIVAKARAAVEDGHGLCPDGDFPSDGMKWAWDVVQALVRMGEAR